MYLSNPTPLCYMGCFLEFSGVYLGVNTGGCYRVNCLVAVGILAWSTPKWEIMRTSSIFVMAMHDSWFGSGTPLLNGFTSNPTWWEVRYTHTLLLQVELNSKSILNHVVGLKERIDNDFLKKQKFVIWCGFQNITRGYSFIECF